MKSCTCSGFRSPRSRVLPEHAGVHVHVLLLARRARARVGDVDAHRLAQLVHVHPVPRVAREGDHGPERGGVDLDDHHVLRALVRVQPVHQRLRLLAAHPALPHQVLHRLGVRRHDPGEGAHLGGHVGHGGALVHGERLHRRAGVLDDLPDGVPVLDVRVAQDLQHEVLGRHVVRLLAVHDHLERPRHLHAHVLGDPGVEDGRGAHAERHRARWRPRAACASRSR